MGDSLEAWPEEQRNSFVTPVTGRYRRAEGRKDGEISGDKETSTGKTDIRH